MDYNVILESLNSILDYSTVNISNPVYQILRKWRKNLNFIFIQISPVWSTGVGIGRCPALFGVRIYV